MALTDLVNQAKQRVKAVYENFFYYGQEAPAPRMQDEYIGGQDPYAQPAPANAQQGYSAPAAGGYQQGYPQTAYAQQPYGQPNPYQPAQDQGRRGRRSQRNQDNVVDFGAYQQNQGQPYSGQSQPAPQVQQAAQAPAQPQPAPQQPQAAESPVPAGSVCARIINARGMSDCRSAITLLRKGDSVLIVLENVTDPAEMRRLVDTLSGACYSLTATITKVSRYGVYLLAPQNMAVFTDQATNMMNSAPNRGQPRNYPGFAHAQRGYAPQTAYPPQSGYQQPQPNPYAQPVQPQPFTQRTAAPEEPPQNFYQRPAPQEAQAPVFAPQPAGYGYAPDETQAVDQ